MNKRTFYVLFALLTILNLSSCAKYIEDNDTKKVSNSMDNGYVSSVKLDNETTSSQPAEKNELKEGQIVPSGNYQDVLSKRATMEVSYDNLVYSFIINWGSSASENDKWTFSGMYDEATNTVDYYDSKHVKEIYDAEGNCKETVVYENGIGNMVFYEEKLYWVDTKETKLYDANFNAIFEKLP